MHDPREHGHAVAFNSAGELLPIGSARKVEGPATAMLWHVGAGGLDQFVTSPEVEAAFGGDEVVVAVFADPHEAFEFRARVQLAARQGFAALQRRAG